MKTANFPGYHAYAFVGLGSNQEPEKHIPLALKYMRERLGRLLKSPIYESAAVGFDGPNFWNMVVGFPARLDVDELVAVLNQIEDACGRDREAERWSSRTLDLDLLVYGNEQINSEKLTLPRGDILRYAFVLKPLVDIQPQRKLPGTNKTYTALWAEFDQDSQPLKRVILSKTSKP